MSVLSCSDLLLSCSSLFCCVLPLYLLCNILLYPLALCSICSNILFYSFLHWFDINPIFICFSLSCTLFCLLCFAIFPSTLCYLPVLYSFSFFYLLLLYCALYSLLLSFVLSCTILFPFSLCFILSVHRTSLLFVLSCVILCSSSSWMLYSPSSYSVLSYLISFVYFAILSSALLFSVLHVVLSSLFCYSSFYFATWMSYTLLLSSICFCSTLLFILLLSAALSCTALFSLLRYIRSCSQNFTLVCDILCYTLFF